MYTMYIYSCKKDCLMIFLPKPHLYQTGNFFIPPTSKKLRGHIGFGLSIRRSIHPFHMEKNG